MAVLWRPEPPVSYLDVPSASPEPPGFAVFHDMVERQAAGARRVLGRASMMPESVGVLVVLSPTGRVPEAHREEMLEWASSGGGTLVIGYPILGEDGERISSFVEDATWPISTWAESGDKYDAELTYIPGAADPPREVPRFGHVMRGEMELAEFGAEALVAGDGGEPVVSFERYGAGTLIQIADSGLLDNRSLGWKQTHLFAAALLDEVGRDEVWAFDESHEGVEAEPSLITYLGSGRWRAVVLQVMLLLLFLYWWSTSRIGRPAAAPSRVDVREVTTLARDVGDFYFRAHKSAWALSRTLELFGIALKGRGIAGPERDAAAELARQAQVELESGAANAEKHASLIRKMAQSQRRLARSSKGKKL